MVAGLVLIALMMQSVQSPQMEMRLAMLLQEEGPPASSQTFAESRPAAEEWIERVDRELLKSINDDAPFRNDETGAWFHLWQLALESAPAELQQASEGPISYAQLMQQPDYYRGRVVTVRGIVHRIEQIPAAKNDLGIESIYLVWIQPGGTDRLPFQFCCLELPPGYSLGEMTRPVRGHGIFFKNRVYQHGEGIDKCPVLIARTFQDLSPPTREAAEDSSPLLFPTTTLVVALAIAVVVVLFIWRSAFVPSPARHPLRQGDEVAEELRHLEGEVANEPSEPQV